MNIKLVYRFALVALAVVCAYAMSITGDMGANAMINDEGALISASMGLLTVFLGCLVCLFGGMALYTHKDSAQLPHILPNG